MNHIGDDIQTRIRSLDSIPPFPASATQIMSEVDNPDGQVQKIVQLIECEPAISSKVLQMANSPMFGASRPIVSIGQSVVLLGFKTVAQQAMCVATQEVFDGGTPEFKVHRQKTFKQSLACGTLARILAGDLNVTNADEAFLSGVMHEIGKLVLFNSVPEVYCKILEENPNGETTDVETEVLGIAHPEIGNSCGTRWGLPSSINQAIKDHHAPMSQVAEPLSRSIIAANYFARKWHIGFEANEEVVELREIEELFSSEKKEAFRAAFEDQFAAVSKIYT